MAQIRWSWYNDGMKKDKVQISEVVLQLASKMAKRRDCSPSEMISKALQQYRDELQWWKDIQADVQAYYRRSGKKPLTMDEIDDEVHAYRREQQSKRTDRH